MDAIISDFVTRFERGGLTRRQAIQGLSALGAGGPLRGFAGPAGAQAPNLQAATINHTSVLVTDLQRSADFYGKVFGLLPVSEDKDNKILRLGAGGTGVNATRASLRAQKPSGLIDHFAIGVQGFNRDTATQVLKQHGLTPANNIEFGFHVK